MVLRKSLKIEFSKDCPGLSVIVIVGETAGQKDTENEVQF